MTGPWSRAKWFFETQPERPDWRLGNVGLKLQTRPYSFSMCGYALEQCARVGRTISGANGSDAATAHGASVPSSGPYGTPRATYPRKRRVTPLIRRVAGPGPLLAVMPQASGP